MSKDNEIEIVESTEQVSPDVIYSQDKAAIDVQIATAHAFPRKIKQATEDAIAIVTIDMETAKSCTYALPRGGKSITGPSVHLAKILAQCWGNMRIEAKVVSIDAKQITSEAVCFDLQKNLAIKTQIKRSIMQNEYSYTTGKPVKTGRMLRMNDDMITVTGNASNSIALRNAILSVIPKGVVDKVYNASKAMVTGDISDETKLIARRKQVVQGLIDTYNVTEKDVLMSIGKAAVSHIDGDDIITLIGIGTAIKEGDTTIELAFKTVKKDADDKKKDLKDKQKEEGKKEKKDETKTGKPGDQAHLNLP